MSEPIGKNEKTVKIEKKVRIPGLDEEYLFFVHPSGMRVFLSKKDFHTSYGLLTVDFGSVEESGKVNGKDFSVPDGSAHFLEHKMFENPDGTDTFAYFSSIGSEANAYTGSDRTCYLFETPENAEEALEVLLRSTLTPWFTDQNVRKEKGIIVQELKMYRDNPHDAIGRALLSCMYRNRALSKDICGSVKSVRSVTKEDLYRAFRTFYIPSNMILTLCGRFDEERVKAILDSVLPEECPPAPEFSLIGEDLPGKVIKRRKKIFIDVRTPVVSIGIKCPTAETNGEQRLKAFHKMSILSHALFSPSSAYVSGLKKANLLPGDTSYEVIHNENCSNVLFFARTYDPRETIARFEKAAKELLAKGLKESAFERGKKLLYSDFLENFNSSEGVASLLASDALDGIDTSQTPRLIFECEKPEVEALAKRVLTKETVCILTSLPKELKTTKKRKEANHECDH